jgi:prepilin-type N-terminal cleavage/methylation domain-containing protein
MVNIHKLEIKGAEQVFWTKTRQFARNEQGFSLIELLGVAVILVILSLITLMNVASATDKVRTASSATNLQEIENALERYKAFNGHYPTHLDMLDIKPNFTFETAWSTPDHPIFYFYAVDAGKGPAQAYVLGDPGPTANCDTVPQTTTLHADSTYLLPCGRSPHETAWAWYSNITLDLIALDGSSPKPRSLAGFRPDIKTES